MEITLPIYVEADGPDEQHRCRLLFAPPGEPGFEGRGDSLRRASHRLVQDLKLRLDMIGRSPEHRFLVPFTFSPELDSHVLKLSIDLRDRVLKCRYLFVTFERFGRQIAFTPSLPWVWFECPSGETLEATATRVLAEEFRRMQREGDHELHGAPPSIQGQAWITHLDINVRTEQVTRQERQRDRALLWDTGKMDGAVELRRVGRCLDWLYPEDLARCVLRERELAELTRLAQGSDRRPILVLGPRMSGKTALIHEYVFRHVAGHGKPYSEKENVWLVSPQRLISGMSYVGQWENRLLAILDEVTKRQHVLYFDDLLGLYHAGQSRDSRLSVAEVLKTQLQRKRLRVLAEATPEAFQALAERDRGFADQFHVIRLDETGEDDTLRILLAAARRFELQHRCTFGLDVIPTVVEIQRRYVRDAVFPGKGVQFLQHLAVQAPRQDIDRARVYQEFHAKTGLSLALLDQARKIVRKDVLAQLGRRLIGQPAALEAAADVVALAKARLQPPDRPLATLLFLGPTGVGKTECAKTLAEYLFASESKLIRLDMNEFGSPRSAARLAGTIDEPEGLLSSAIRRQPFSVILLDEIEKAHADVFDLLLQVMGEGRITDALGRTADFSNAIVIMTSNLGTRQSGRSLGFAGDQASRQQVFTSAVEAFFRPEFVNRIDRIIPFDELDRAQISRIAKNLMDGLLAREGLVRRRCLLEVDPRARQRVIDAGYHPQLGARALKRAIERQLAQPLSAQLAAMRPEAPTVIRVYAGPADLQVRVEELREAAPLPPRGGSVEERFERVSAFIERLAQRTEATRPKGEITSQTLTPAHIQFYGLLEELRVLRIRRDEVLRELERRQQPSLPAISPRSPGLTKPDMLRGISPRRTLVDLAAAREVHAYIRELAREAGRVSDPLEEQLQELERFAAWAAAMAREPAFSSRTVLLLRDISLVNPSIPAGPGHMTASWARNLLHGVFEGDCDLAADKVADEELCLLDVSGPGASAAAAAAVGTLLVCDERDRLSLVQIHPVAVDDSLTGPAIAAEVRRREQSWLEALERGQADFAADPFPLAPVLRIFNLDGGYIDLRTGAHVPIVGHGSHWRDLLFAALPDFETV